MDLGVQKYTSHFSEVTAHLLIVTLRPLLKPTLSGILSMALFHLL